MWFLPDFRQVYDPFKLNMDKNRERHFNCCGTPKVGFLYFPSFSEFFDSTLSKMRALPQFSCFCCFETTPSVSVLFFRAVDDPDTEADQHDGKQAARDVQLAQFVQQQRRQQHAEHRVQEGEDHDL